MILSFKIKIDNIRTYFPEKILKSIKMNCEDITKCGFWRFGMIWHYLDQIFQSKGYDFDNRVYLNTYPKIHSIREDKKERWFSGRDIHFVINNRSKNFLQFAPIIKCKSVQKIRIEYNPGGGVNVFIDDKYFYYQTSWGLPYDESEVPKMIALARNDGFNSINHFFRYFNKNFTGKIIHWTDLKY